MTTKEFAALIRQKYPKSGALSDQELVDYVLEIEPNYASRITDLVPILEPEIMDDRNLPQNRHRTSTEIDNAHATTYSGPLKEWRKRRAIKETYRTRQEGIGLITQERVATEELNKLHHARGEASRLPKQNKLKDLELDEQMESKLTAIAKHKAARANLANPSPRRNPRNITVDPEDDDD